MLSELPEFELFPIYMLNSLASHMHIKTYKPGEIIVKKNVVNNMIFII